MWLEFGYIEMGSFKTDLIVGIDAINISPNFELISEMTSFRTIAEHEIKESCYARFFSFFLRSPVQITE